MLNKNPKGPNFQIKKYIYKLKYKSVDILNFLKCGSFI